MDGKHVEKSCKQRDRPRARDRLARWFRRWGADLLLVAGAVCMGVGFGMLYQPLGLIISGAFLIAGGVLAARGADGGEGG
jgi:hypothetical protein